MNYKEKYKRALERAQQAVDKGQVSQNFVDDIFAEHKLSRDERIRKGLIKAVSGILKGNTLYGTDVTREEALTWLEKQEEKKPAEDAKALDADKVIEWLKITINERAENYGVYKETRLILPYNSIEDLINDFKEDFGL